MKKSSSTLPFISRSLIFICGLLMIAVLFVPLWRIELNAPQYPEGLELLIYPHKIAGNVDIINGLNHYIGMKTLHTEEFIEFKLLPYIISVFALAFIAVALINRKKAVVTLLVSFILFGIIAMADFWKWEYDYGHDLDPNAAIQVPGMAYQPPLIGFKQLLNFGAFSIPALGGWMFIVAGLLLITSLFLARQKAPKVSPALVFSSLTCMLMACSTDPSPFRLGVDQCSYCNMTISNPRFGTQVITQKGKTYKYDDITCMLSDLKEGNVNKSDVKMFYAADFSRKLDLIEIENSTLVKHESIRSPMNSNIAIFSDGKDADNYIRSNSGSIISWKELYK